VPPPQKRPHIAYRPGLDGLRALAVAAVFLYHAKPHADGGSWLPGGFLGVDLFFVLSGYLITSLLLVEWERDHRVMLIDFWKRRARRLFPAVVVVILAALAMAALWGNAALSALSKTRGDAISGLFYVNNWHQIIANESYFGGKGSLLQHLWSLSVEEQFYIFWPLLLVGGLLLVGRQRMPLLVVGGIALSATLMWVLFDPNNASADYFGTHTRAFLLLMGALLALLWPTVERLGGMALRGLEILGFAALGIGIWLFFSLHDFDSSYYHGGDLAISFGFAILIAAVAHPATMIGRAFGVAPLRWIGERSYGIYLWHYPIVVVLVPGLSWGLTGAAAILVEAAIVVVAATLSYHFIEQPIRTQRLQKRLAELGARRRTELMAACAAALGVAFAILFAAPISTSAAPPHPTTKTSPTTTPTTHTTTTTTRPKPPKKPRVLPKGKMLALGDSVMLGCESALIPALDNRVRVDAAVGRQIKDTIALLDQYRAKGHLPKIVIIQVGNNGPLLYDDMQDLKAALRGIPDIVMVNVRNDTSWQNESNGALTEWLRTFRRVHLADWYHHSTNAMLSDGTHPWPYACKIYANVIKTTLKGTKA
jgi:peptidoglycan/LPS O-acetylase OafA/YrhL